MNSPRVSVLIITFNQQDFVEQTLRSALEQEYENLEVIVSDDASEDSTPDIIRSLANEYPGRLVPLLGEKNVGITSNLNRALSFCTGEYVAFQGGDDTLCPGKIKKQVEFMQLNPDCPLSYHDLDVFDSDTGEVIYLWSQRYGRLEGDARSVVRYGPYMGATSVMVRRKYLPENGVDERIQITSDWFLWVYALASGNGHAGYLNNTLARYRRHSKNVTSSWAIKLQDEHMTLSLVEILWPDYITAVRLRRADLYLMEAMQSFAERHYGTAIKLLLRATFGALPWIAPWLRLVFRELRFLIQRKGKLDDLVGTLVGSKIEPLSGRKI